MRLIIPLVKYIIFNILELEFEYPLVEIWCQTIGKSVFWLSWKVALRDFALILFETSELCSDVTNLATNEFGCVLRAICRPVTAPLASVAFTAPPLKHKLHTWVEKLQRQGGNLGVEIFDENLCLSDYSDSTNHFGLEIVKGAHGTHVPLECPCCFQCIVSAFCHYEYLNWCHLIHTILSNALWSYAQLLYQQHK